MAQSGPAEFPVLSALPAPIDVSYSPVLTIPRRLPPAGAPCDHCCHWSLPLRAPYVGRQMARGVALAFEEWLLYNFHVVQHQACGAAA